MPVVRIEALPQGDAVELESVLAAVCRDVATFLGEEPRGIWATWHTLERYVEGTGTTPALQPRATHPPLVRLITFQGKKPEEVAGLLRCVAETLVRELALDPGNVFVAYEEARRGRLFTGGEVVS